ncbi:hypothetical protein Golob_004319 [Gossypium lobatum]|uniref:Uncharacterized protein n=1 Tax=Gossypium lobatum TaxID=34289 RepID=A0A7J8N1C2_9ROSI|nr:hypothetical protein [Gossypium lobatum]
MRCKFWYLLTLFVSDYEVGHLLCGGSVLYKVISGHYTDSTVAIILKSVVKTLSGVLGWVGVLYPTLCWDGRSWCVEDGGWEWRSYQHSDRQLGVRRFKRWGFLILICLTQMNLVLKIFGLGIVDVGTLVFTWRLGHEILPTNFKIASIQRGFGLGCPRCEVEYETLIHALKDFPMSRAILSIGGWNDSTISKDYKCCVDWLEDMMRVLDKKSYDRPYDYIME